jgi:myo-inositol-1(or 4)-monophosphatase
MASFLETGTEITREAGALLLQYLERRVGFELKGEHDLVTEADRASEQFVVERLRSYFPSHAIVAEEGNCHEGSSDYRWYVDPLDGTTNFAHGFPVFNITIALERAGEMICGVVFDPTRQEMFTAELGGGAYLNNRRIRVTRTDRLDSCLVATGFPSRRRHLDVNVHFYYQLSMITHGVRRAGAAALDLAYVACGRLDAFWEFALNPWDMAAGLLLVVEAGGSYTDMLGEPHDLRGPNLIASNGFVHDEIVTVFRDIFGSKYRFPIPGLHT